MEISTIAELVDYFSIAAIIVLAVFAVWGVTTIFGKKSCENVLLSASCVAVIVAFALEATVFNFSYYLRYFAGPQTGTIEESETAPNIILTTDGTQVELIENNGGVRFSNLNRKVTSVFVDLIFNNLETVEILVAQTDNGITRQRVKRLYKYLPRENYVPLRPYGKVSELTINFKVVADTASSVDLTGIIINKPIPFYCNGLRLSIISLLLFAFFSLINKNLRARCWPI